MLQVERRGRSYRFLGGEMQVLSNISRAQLRSKLKRDEAFKIAPGLYTDTAPTPDELAELLLARWPRAALDGSTAVSATLNQPLQFPIQLVAPTKIASGELFQCRKRTHVPFTGERRRVPVVFAIEALDDAAAIDALERCYRGRNGRDRLEHALSLMTRVPGRTRGLIDRAATGSDSPAEQDVVRALRKAGFHVESNYKIGHYWWDIVLPRYKVAIEIDGYDFHNGENRDVFVKDRWKGNDATMRGYKVLRYSGSCTVHHLNMVVHQVEAVCKKTGFIPEAIWRWHVLWADGFGYYATNDQEVAGSPIFD